MYPEIMVIPMREELTRAGVTEARSAAEVDAAVAQKGTTMVVVNSICGCAAGKMRPGVRLALQHGTKPDHAVAVFAGQDVDALDGQIAVWAGEIEPHLDAGRIGQGRSHHELRRGQDTQGRLTLKKASRGP